MAAPHSVVGELGGEDEIELAEGVVSGGEAAAEFLEHGPDGLDAVSGP